MKKLFSMALIAVFLNLPMTVYAYNYSFETGADNSSFFGESTSIDTSVSVNAETENIRRNKDAAYYPPAYGIFSGDIPTDQISLYHDNSNQYSGYDGHTESVEYSTNVSSIQSEVINDVMLPSTSLYSETVINTLPLYYKDGSIGTLSVPSVNLSVKVYGGEALESMKKGAWHFDCTSAWDNNIGFAGHNRGTSAYFSGVKNISIGDTITYTTRYGTRKYRVYLKKQITDTDYSYLGWSSENIVTLITCVENVPGKRLVVQAKEVK